MDITFEVINLAQICLIKPVWEELNQIHMEDSPYFKDHYKKFSFEKRLEFFKNIQPQNIRIEIAKIPGKQLAGYCIASIKEGGTGEIDSICVGKNFRKSGIGEYLIQKSLEWLKSKECLKIQLSVSYGHESVFPFYEKFGFFPRLTVLEMK